MNAMKKCLNSTEHIEEICDAYIIENINVYISTINQYLEALAQRIHYVQPLRAISQRYYRISNVAVDEIDSDAIMNFLGTDLKLDSIEIGHFRDDKYYDVPSDSIKNYLKHYKKMWGSDIESVCLEIEIDGEDYTLFMLCVCYDDRWYIADFNNPITLSLGISPGGKGLVPEEYLEY